MNSYKEMLEQDRRLAILRMLLEVNGQANDSVIHHAVEALGHARQPRDQIRQDIRFLNNNGLVDIEWLENVMVASITLRGQEAAEGRIAVPGIKKPGIGR